MNAVTAPSALDLIANLLTDADIDGNQLPPIASPGRNDLSEEDARACYPEPLYSQLSLLIPRVRETGHELTLFPLRPIPCDCPKGIACDRVGKHPATLWNPRELGAGEQRPRKGARGYGIATGARSGIIVLDFDNDEAFRQITTKYDWTPGTFMVATPRGVHVYLQHPGRHVKTSAGEIAPGVDVRADGGFVVAPGSVHKSGGTYRIDGDWRIAECPAWLLNHPATRSKGRATRPGEVIPMPEVIVDADDLRWRVEAARYWLASRAEPCVSGVNGQKNIWLAGLQLMRTYELPLDVAASLFSEHFNPRCTDRDGAPCPWEAGDVERVLTRARDHGTRMPGCPSPAAVRAFFACIGGGK